MSGESTNDATSASKKQDIFVATIYILIAFGEGIETYLPGVITQYVSCDIGVSAFQEGLLGCIFFLTIPVGVFLGGTIANKIGVRKLLLASLYLNCLATVACAVVANYLTLSLSRALIGFCIGLIHVHSVFVTKYASPQFKDKILFAGILSFTIGSSYIAVLGYLILDYAGWRVFILLSSLPIFILPILLLHTEFTETGANVSADSPLLRHSDNSVEAPQEEEKEEKSSNASRLKVLQLMLHKFAIFYAGRGTVMLMPSLIEAFNVSQVIEGTDPCETITAGSDFLILAAVFSFSIVGRITGYLTRNSPNFRVYLIIPSVLLILSYAAMLLDNSLIIIVISGAIIKIVYSQIMIIVGFIYYDERYFKHTGLNLTIGTSIIFGVGELGGFAGTAVASFVSATDGVIGALIMSVVVFIIPVFMPGTFRIQED